MSDRRINLNIHRRLTVLGSMIVCLSVLPSPAQPEKNIDIINHLVVQVMSEVEQDLANRSTDSLYIMIGDHDIADKEYLGFTLDNFFKQKHFTVFRNNDAPAAFHGLILDINGFITAIDYTKPYTKRFLGRSYRKREIRITLQGQVQSRPAAEVISTFSRSENYQDEVPDDRVAELESSGYPFTQGQRQGFSRWQVFIEPVLAVASVGVIIYLFYTKRS